MLFQFLVMLNHFIPEREPLSVLVVSAQQAQLKKTRNLSLLPAHIVSWSVGTMQTLTPDPESFIEASQSAGALPQIPVPAAIPLASYTSYSQL